MANLTIENIDLSSVVIQSGEYGDELLTHTATTTFLPGTILARDSSTLKMVPYVKGGTTDDNGIPKALLTYEVDATGAGDVAIRVLLNGVLRHDKLVIDADGDASNVDAAVLDGLRSYGLVTQDVVELNKLDNQ